MQLPYLDCMRFSKRYLMLLTKTEIQFGNMKLCGALNFLSVCDKKNYHRLGSFEVKPKLIQESFKKWVIENHKIDKKYMSFNLCNYIWYLYICKSLFYGFITSYHWRKVQPAYPRENTRQYGFESEKKCLAVE